MVLGIANPDILSVSGTSIVAERGTIIRISVSKGEVKNTGMGI